MTRFYLCTLRRVLAPADQGQPRCRRGGPVRRARLDVAGARQEAGLPRHAENRSVPDHSATHLSLVRADALDRAGLDAGSPGARGHLDSLLAPRLKERRFEKRYGERFRAYRRRVPYAVPLARATQRFNSWRCRGLFSGRYTRSIRVWSGRTRPGSRATGGLSDIALLFICMQSHLPTRRSHQVQRVLA